MPTNDSGLERCPVSGSSPVSRLSLWKLGSPGASSSPGARPAVHAGKCSPGGVHLHIKIKKPQKGGSILFKLRSGFSLPQLAGAGPESRRSCPEAPPFQTSLRFTASSLFGSPAPQRVLQQLGLPRGAGDGGILPPWGGGSGGGRGKSPLSAAA